MRSSDLIRCFTASLVASQPANIKIVFVYINFVFNFGDANIASIDLASQTESEYACMIVVRGRQKWIKMASDYRIARAYNFLSPRNTQIFWFITIKRYRECVYVCNAFVFEFQMELRVPVFLLLRTHRRCLQKHCMRFVYFHQHQQSKACIPAAFYISDSG